MIVSKLDEYVSPFLQDSDGGQHAPKAELKKWMAKRRSEGCWETK